MSDFTDEISRREFNQRERNRSQEHSFFANRAIWDGKAVLDVELTFEFDENSDVRKCEYIGIHSITIYPSELEQRIFPFTDYPINHRRTLVPNLEKAWTVELKSTFADQQEFCQWIYDQCEHYAGQCNTPIVSALLRAVY